MVLVTLRNVVLINVLLTFMGVTSKMGVIYKNMRLRQLQQC